MREGPLPDKCQKPLRNLRMGTYLPSHSARRVMVRKSIIFSKYSGINISPSPQRADG